MICIIKVNLPFTDKETGELLKTGDTLITKDLNRARNIIEYHRLGSLKEIKNELKKNGKKIVIYHEWLAPIGGIETSLYCRSRAFPKSNITFVFKRACLEQAFRLGKNHNVLIDDGTEDLPEADVLIVETYNGYSQIKGRIKSKKTYQMCHADWASLKEVSRTFRNFEWEIDPDIDKVISVSETVQKSLKTAFKKPIESIIVGNIPPKSNPSFRTFLTLSRLTSEKGGDRIVRMVQEFHKQNRHFLWLIAADYSSDIKVKLRQDPCVVFLDPSTALTGLVGRVDYLVQLSDSESWCYAAHEAAAVGTPIIGTRIPELEKLVKTGENGYLVNLDLSDLDVKAIFEKKPAPPPVNEQIDPNWEKLLKGES